MHDVDTCFVSFVIAAGNAEPLVFFVILGIFSLIAVFFFVHAWQQEKQRAERFQQIAQEINLPFYPNGDDSLLTRLGHFHLFSQGHSKKISNMFHGETNDVELAIFDFRFTVGRGKNAHTSHQSIIYFSSPKLQLPVFALRPESLFHKIGSAFGYQDIDFETHPQFSKSYLLKGNDESRIRELFTNDVLAFVESQQQICVEGGGVQLIFYRQHKRIKPDEVRQFMEEGFRVFSLFRGPADA